MLVSLLRPTSRAPERASGTAGAYDCFCDEFAILNPGEKRKIGLGFKMALLPNQVALLLPRSSSGSKGIHLANQTGVIDSDYRGEVIANIHNKTEDRIVIKEGDRLFQLLVVNTSPTDIVVVEEVELGTTARGEGGFGSTGT